MRATRPYTAPIHTGGRCVLLWLWCGVYYHFNSAVHYCVVEVRAVVLRASSSQ